MDPLRENRRIGGAGGGGGGGGPPGGGGGGGGGILVEGDGGSSFYGQYGGDHVGHTILLHLMCRLRVVSSTSLASSACCLFWLLAASMLGLGVRMNEPSVRRRIIERAAFADDTPCPPLPAIGYRFVSTRVLVS